MRGEELRGERAALEAKLADDYLDACAAALEADYDRFRAWQAAEAADADAYVSWRAALLEEAAADDAEDEGLEEGDVAFVALAFLAYLVAYAVCVGLVLAAIHVSRPAPVILEIAPAETPALVASFTARVAEVAAAAVETVAAAAAETVAPAEAAETVETPAASASSALVAVVTAKVAEVAAAAVETVAAVAAAEPAAAEPEVEAEAEPAAKGWARSSIFWGPPAAKKGRHPWARGASAHRIFG